MPEMNVVSTLRVICFLVSVLCAWVTEADVVQLTSSNLDEVLSNNELVFINFYADWCRFSQMLNPVFEEAGRKIEEEFPDVGRAAFGRVNCDIEGGLAGRFHVSKYPTLKLFRFGKLMRREYRGQRSAEALTEYARSHLNSPVTTYTSPDELYNIDIRKRTIIGYYDSLDSAEYKLFVQVSSILRDDCSFYSLVRTPQDGEEAVVSRVVFREPLDRGSEAVYPGLVSNYDMLLQWADEKCFPAVRELTFENAEELTEEGLPFFILFHHPDDYITPDKYRSIVTEELLDEKRGVNFLIANGLKFSHPLHHLGKSANDLPLIAIDSFRHMYLWPRDARTEVDKPGLLKQFIADLHSGKLHREFHQGPDPTPPPPPVEPAKQEQEQAPEAAVTPEAAPANTESTEEKALEASGGHIPKDPDPVEEAERETAKPESARTSPPESIFRKLAPSRNRYTILRDEL